MVHRGSTAMSVREMIITARFLRTRFFGLDISVRFLSWISSNVDFTASTSAWHWVIDEVLVTLLPRSHSFSYPCLMIILSFSRWGKLLSSFFLSLLSISRFKSRPPLLLSVFCPSFYHNNFLSIVLVRSLCIKTADASVCTAAFLPKVLVAIFKRVSIR